MQNLPKRRDRQSAKEEEKEVPAGEGGIMSRALGTVKNIFSTNSNKNGNV